MANWQAQDNNSYAFLQLGRVRAPDRLAEIQLTWVPLSLAYRADPAEAWPAAAIAALDSLGIALRSNLSLHTCMLVQSDALALRNSNKLVYALVRQLPIVAPAYCDAIHAAFDAPEGPRRLHVPARALLDIADLPAFPSAYKISPTMITQQLFPDPAPCVSSNDVRLLPNDARRTLFKGLVFVLWGSDLGLDSILLDAGGRCERFAEDLHDDVTIKLAAFLDLRANSPEHRHVSRVVPVEPDHADAAAAQQMKEAMRAAAQQQARAVRTGRANSGKVEVCQPVSALDIASAVRETSLSLLVKDVVIAPPARAGGPSVVEVGVSSTPADNLVPIKEELLSQPAMSVTEPASPLKQPKKEEDASQNPFLRRKPRSNPFLSGVASSTKKAPVATSLDAFFGAPAVAPKRTASTTTKKSEPAGKVKSGAAGKNTALMDLWSRPSDSGEPQGAAKSKEQSPVPDEKLDEEMGEADAQPQGEPASRGKRVSVLSAVTENWREFSAKRRKLDHAPEPVIAAEEPPEAAPEALPAPNPPTNATVSKFRAMQKQQQQKQQKPVQKVRFDEAILDTKLDQEDELSGAAGLSAEEIAAFRDLALVEEMEVLDAQFPATAAGRGGGAGPGPLDTIVEPSNESRDSSSGSRWGLRPNFKTFLKSSFYGSVMGRSAREPSYFGVSRVGTPAVAEELVEADPREGRERAAVEFLEPRRPVDREATAGAGDETREPRDDDDSLFVGGAPDYMDDEEEETEEERAARAALSEAFEEAAVSKPRGRGKAAAQNGDRAVSQSEFARIVEGRDAAPASPAAGAPRLLITDGAEDDDEPAAKRQRTVATRAPAASQLALGTRRARGTLLSQVASGRAPPPSGGHCAASRGPAAALGGSPALAAAAVAGSACEADSGEDAAAVSESAGGSSNSAESGTVLSATTPTPRGSQQQMSRERLESNRGLLLGGQGRARRGRGR